MGKSDTLSQRSDHGSGTNDNQNLTLLSPDLFAIRALEGLQVAGEEKDILKEIRCGMEAGDQEEVVVKAVKECPQIQAMPSDPSPLSLFKTCRTPWKMEDLGTSLKELLVAADVQVHRQICLYL